VIGSKRQALRESAIPVRSSMLFPTRAATVGAIVELVFEWADPENESWQKFATKRASISRLPLWTRYLNDRCSPLWREFSRQQRDRAFAGLANFFSSVVEGADQDLNERFFSAYETRGGSPLDYNGKPGFLKLLRRNLDIGSWSGLIQKMGQLLPPEQRNAKYERHYAGSATAPFYRQIATTEVGKQLLAAIDEAPIGGGQQWQTLWRMLHACALLAESGGDFEAFLRESGVFEILGTDLPMDSSANFLREWKSRERVLSKIAATLPGVGANTLQYVLRDLDYPGCMSLFKLESNNQKIFTLLFGEATAKNRAKLVDTLVRSGVHRSYPLAVINMACYAFGTRKHLNLFGSLKRGAGGRFKLTL